MNKTTRLALALLSTVALTGIAAPAFAQSGEVNIYSYREQSLLQPLLDKFSAETGIKPNVLFAGDGLLERVAAEGELSPADVVLTVDIGNLVGAEEQGLTQKITTPVLDERVPQAFRATDDNWTALSLRSRVFYVSKDRVDATALTYDDLATPEWKGRICTRSGNHAYNIGLIAHYIAEHGIDAARVWLGKVRDNLAMAPSGNDRIQVKNILEGTCDLAITNTYYMGAMLHNEAEPEQKDWANSARIIYPDAETDGTQVNVAGGFIAKYAPNVENANTLIAFLLSDEAQAIYADTNYEFPVVPSAPINELVASWGTLKPSQVSLVDVASHRAEAAALVDELKFDEGPQN
ncbi:extracellular solute-binding protein [Devosia sp. 2618]|uniref:extracellular solute-binding protein n=1 Tax=Devosia sp. 2618 TaxID=3156454 RepID=UPI003392B8AF